MTFEFFPGGSHFARWKRCRFPPESPVTSCEARSAQSSTIFSLERVLRPQIHPSFNHVCKDVDRADCLTHLVPLCSDPRIWMVGHSRLVNDSISICTSS